MRLLIIEDEKDIGRTLKEVLSKTYGVDVVHTGEQGLYQAQVNDYDLIILDLGLPDVNGIEVCRKIRFEQVAVPILVLTGRQDVEDKVTALDAGADDYLTKPFHFDELHARTRALLRRKRDGLTSNVLEVSDLVLDVKNRTVRRAQQPIELRRKEFDLLEYFMRNPGRVLTRQMILEHIWDDEVNSFTNVIDVHIKYLRDKIDRPFGKQLIRTVHGLGYKISDLK